MEVVSREVLENGQGFQVRFQYRKMGTEKLNPDNFMVISLTGEGWAGVEYSFEEAGLYDHIGVTFDFPEQEVRQVQWLGNGPYRVWKNREKGVLFGLWTKDYNNTVTGESWTYPEFKGFHSNLYAARINTDSGILTLLTETEDLYLHLLTPDLPQGRNNDNTLGVFPSGQISVLNAISAVGTKFYKAEQMGPQGQKNAVWYSDHSDGVTGKFYMRFE